MIAQAFHIHVERIDPGRNMARFYALSIEPCLFGVALIRRWGRIGTGGRQQVEPMACEGEAIRRFLTLAAAKKRKGYRPRPAQNCQPPKIEDRSCLTKPPLI